MEIARAVAETLWQSDVETAREGDVEALMRLLRETIMSHTAAIYNNDHFIGAAITPAKPRGAHRPVSAETVRWTTTWEFEQLCASPTIQIIILFTDDLHSTDKSPLKAALP